MASDDVIRFISSLQPEQKKTIRELEIGSCREIPMGKGKINVCRMDEFNFALREVTQRVDEPFSLHNLDSVSVKRR